LSADVSSGSLALRAALGRYTTGVTIVTCVAADGHRIGLTVNSFNALSLSPPLVLWSLRESSPSLAHFTAASHFVINVLAQHQQAVSRRFASSTDDKFAEGAWLAGEGGAPVLADCCAVLECEAYSQQLAGDHTLFIGRVVKARHHTHPPLLYQAGHYHALGEALPPKRTDAKGLS
jgi:4-hydroxyphenylacetate 3-hydroxylase, reductase component